MWLVLCSANDIAGLWAYRGLKSFGLRPLEIVPVESLVYSTSIKHCIESNKVSTEIKLADGRTINSATVRGILNRIYSLPAEHLQSAYSADRKYAEQEIQAFFLSWLYAMPGTMFNRPTPQGLCGSWMHLSKWFRLASQAGLATEKFCQGSHVEDVPPLYYPDLNTQSIIVLNDDCFGAAAPPSIRQGCIKLAKASRTAMLGIDFSVSKDGEWIFAGATPLPEIRLGGESLLRAVFEAFQI